MKTCRAAAVGLALWALLFAPAARSRDWKVAVPDYEWSFPRDHWSHEGYRVEWWYLTGHLTTEAGRRFAYQFTLFRVGVVPVGSEPVSLDSDWAASSFLMGHAAITDIDAKRHVFSEVLYREIPLLGGVGAFPDPPIGWSRGPAGTSQTWDILWNGDAFDVSMRDDDQGIALSLSTHPLKPFVFQGPNGFSRKGDGAGAASQYYSFTRLATSGELEIGGTRAAVRGVSWMDKEFSSSQLGPEQVGWDWFSLQLDDGRELMLYLMRRNDGSTDYQNGTLVAEDGSVRYLEPSQATVEVLDTWTSPETEARYPARWRIALPGEDSVMEVRPVLADQENRSRLPGGVYYWEGAVDVLDGESETIGRGFVELTGYGENNRPPI